MSKSKTKKSTKSTKPAPAAKPRQGGKQTATPSAIPKALQTPEFAAAWADWQRFHADRGIELTAENTGRQLELLARLGPDQAVEDIRNTIAEHPSRDGAELPAEPTAETVEPATPPLVADQPTPVPAVEEAGGAGAEAAPQEVAVADSTPTEPAETEPAQPPTDAPPAAAAPEKQPATPKMPRSTGQLSAIDEAAQVLAAAGQPMTCQQLIEAMATQGLWSSPKGRTPAGTLYSAILREQATKGAEARFVKAGRGQFTHRASV